MSVKLVSLATAFNLGVSTLAEKLQGKGFEVANDPNARINLEEFECLAKEFGKNAKPGFVEKTRKRLEGGSKLSEKDTQETAADKHAPAKPDTKEVSVIATEIPEERKPQLKIKGSINLERAKPKSTPLKTVPEDAGAEAKVLTKAEPHPESVPKSEKSEEKPEAKEVKEASSLPEIKKESVVLPARDMTEKPVEPVVVPQQDEPLLPANAAPRPAREQPAKPAAKPVNARLSGAEEKVRSEKVRVSRAESERPKTQVPKPQIKDEPATEAKDVQSPPAAEASAETSIYSPATGRQMTGVKVVGHMDLAALNASTRPARKSRAQREKERKAATTTGTQTSGKSGKRNRINNKAVDVKAEGNKVASQERRSVEEIRKQREKTTPHGNSPRGGGSRRPQPPVHVAVSDEDVQKQVKETLARLTSKKATTVRGAKYRKDKREAVSRAAEDALRRERLEGKVIKLTEFVTVSDLANMMEVPVNEVIATCMSIGVMVSINQRLDEETLKLVTEEFGFETEFVSADVVEAIRTDEADVDDPADLVERPPIVTVMGHVDHGKTSLLDNVRKTNVIAGEAGGITQHIGAYNLMLANGRHITFLDTPGHEAFTAMRARGAQVTDIAIIIVAADDNVMPQTKEAINHAAAAGVPIVFAINKIDKPAANPEKIREELAALNYLVEDWGGKYQCQEISAKQGVGVTELLEKVLLEADVLELKANPKRRASGSVIESSLDKGRGYISTVLVQNGTLSIGDVVLAGTHHGRIKAMFNERNQRVETAGPSEPVLILGLNGAPTAGDLFNVLEVEQEARNIANKREQLQREQKDRTRQTLTLEEMARRRELGNFQELNVIIKGDVDGSVEALADSLIRLSTAEIQVNVVHKAVGQISESDVVLAAASSAIIIGFQVRPSGAARRQAEQEGVEIRAYSIIYDAIEDVRAAMEGMLSPEIKEDVTATLEVQQTFKITKVGTIAGCMVTEGKIRRSSKVRLIREGIVIHTGKLGSLKRFKDDVKEVVAGLDCGLDLEHYNDVREGDIIEAFDEIEIKKTL